MNNLMIDIETLGTRVGSVITSIGAAFFDPETGEVGEKMSVNIDIEASLQEGLTVDGDTIRWWMMQETDAQMAMLGDALPPKVAYTLFSDWVKEHRSKKLTVWSHATFDVPIIYSAFTKVKVGLPWHFRETGDIRTLSYLTKGMALNSQGNITREGTHHSALDDVLYQIQYTSEMIRALRK